MHLQQVSDEVLGNNAYSFLLLLLVVSVGTALPRLLLYGTADVALPITSRSVWLSEQRLIYLKPSYRPEFMLKSRYLLKKDPSDENKHAHKHPDRVRALYAPTAQLAITARAAAQTL